MTTVSSAVRRLGPFAIVLFGFAMRVHAMDTTWIDGDRANPHGIGLLIVDALSRGQFTEFLLFNDDASTGLPMPPLIGYVWAIVSLFDRSLFMATAVGLMANAVVVAMVFDFGRRHYGWTAGMFAAAISAGSNWGVYLARGTWHPQHLEIGVVAAAWLLSIGVAGRLGRARALLGGFTAVAMTAGSYFGAFFLPAQAALATLIAGGWRNALRRAWLAGLALCALGFAFYGASLVATGRLERALSGFSLVRSEPGVLTEADLIARDITPMNRDPLGHFLRLATNADYALTWTSPDLPGYDVRRSLNDATAVLLSLAVAVGVARMAFGARRPVNRLMLVWALAPILALAAIAALKRDFRVAIYYLLLTTPVQYMAAGWGMAALVMALKRGRTAATAAACVALALVPAWNFAAAAETVYRQPLIDPGFMPLRWSLRLGKLWQESCSLINGSNFWWDLSLFQDPRRWRRGGTFANEFSSAWSVAPQGGTCALKQAGPPLPNAELLPLALDDGSIVRTYRSLPYDAGRPATTTVNLGWTLLHYGAPLSASPGHTVTVIHAWRVDALPEETYWSFYYAPFLKLIGPDGKVAVSVDRAATLEGWQWRPGEIIFSSVDMRLPADLAPGAYVLQSSLFDPNQKKNAVYFQADRPGQAILTLERTLRVEPSPVR